MAFYRKMGVIERLYFCNDYRGLSPLSLNWVIDGKGDLALDTWKAAVNQAMDANPGLRLKNEGYLGFSYWDDEGLDAEVVYLKNCDWNGHGPKLPSFLTDNFDPRKGPFVRVFLCDGDKQMVVFVIHHAITDAVGTLHFVQETFRALRGDPLQGSPSRLMDLDIHRKLKSGSRSDLSKKDCIGLTGEAKGQDLTAHWHRVFIPGRYPNQFPKMIWSICQVATNPQQRSFRFRITTNLRRYTDGDFTIANASGGFSIDVNPEETAKQIQAKIKRSFVNKADRVLPHKIVLILASWMPVRMTTNPPRRLVAFHESGLYRASGTMTNLGFLDTQRFCAPQFTASEAFGIPPVYPQMPLFVSMSSSKKGISVVGTMPELLASDGRLESLLENSKSLFMESF